MADNENNTKTMEERLKAIEVALLRAAKAQEASSKKDGDKSTKGGNNKSEALNMLKGAGETVGNVAGALQKDPAAVAALIKQTFEAVASGIDSMFKGIEQSANSFQNARVTAPKKQSSEFFGQIARLGHEASPEEIKEMGSQLRRGEVASTKAKQKVDKQYAGVNVIDDFIENATGFNFTRSVTGFVQDVGNAWNNHITNSGLKANTKNTVKRKSAVYNATTGGT